MFTNTDEITALIKVLNAIAIPYFFILMALEYAAIRRRAGNTRGITSPIIAFKGYELKDSLCSISMGALKLMTTALAALVMFPLMKQVYEHRLFDLDLSAWWYVPMLLVFDDFCYYWYHRAGHRVALFWAEHSNHHTSEHYNLSTALRQSVLGPFYTFIFWLPMPLLGIDPIAFVLAHTINLLYQYWLHTEVFEVRGVLQYVLNCPQHHRLHHARNAEYHDCNYGGMFSVWDRLFGSFRAYVPGVPPVYGTVKPEPSRNPLFQGVAGWLRLIQKMRSLPRFSQRVQCLFAPPGWMPPTRH